jgi:hypothetical protein
VVYLCVLNLIVLMLLYFLLTAIENT